MQRGIINSRRRLLAIALAGGGAAAATRLSHPGPARAADGATALRANAEGTSSLGVRVDSHLFGIISTAPFAITGNGSLIVGSPPSSAADDLAGGPPSNTGVYGSSQAGEGIGVFGITTT